MAARSQQQETVSQNRIRTGSFRRYGILVISNEVASQAPTHGAKSTHVGSKTTTTTSTTQDFSSSTTTTWRTILPDRCTRLVSPILAQQCRDDEWNERLDPERRNRPDASNDRRPMSVTKATLQRGPTNPIAVRSTKTPVTTLSATTLSANNTSRIPRLNNSNSQQRAVANISVSSGTMDSSLDLSRVGHNRSSSSQSSCCTTNSSSSLVATKPSRLLPPGSIVSAKLAAHQVGRPAPTQSRPQSALIKSKLPVSTTINNRRPDSRSTRSLPESSVPRPKLVRPPTIQQQHPIRTKTPSVRSSIPAVKSVSQRCLPHRNPVTSSKKTTAVGGWKPSTKREADEKRVETEGGSECQAGGNLKDGGEMCCQGRPEGSLSDPKVTPVDLPGQVDHHLENTTTEDNHPLPSQSAKSEETPPSAACATTELVLFNRFHVQSNQILVQQHQQEIAVQCDKMERPLSPDQSNQWTVRINIPAAESNEMLTRLECERRSIRGSTNYSPVADVELLELFERDLLVSSADDKPITTTQADNPQRSLSLPKSFLATRYGLIGLKAALPSGGYLTLSPQKSNNNSAGPVVVRQKWRHSYACDGDMVNPSITNHDNKLYSIREEENYDVATRSATLRAGSLTTLSSFVRFPWRRTEGNRVTTSAASSSHPCGEPHTSLPPSGGLTTAARRPQGSGSTTRTARRFKSTSSPVFIDDDDRVNRSHSAWDLASRPWSHFGEMSVNGSQELVETTSISQVQTEINRELAASPTSNSSTLRKFRKSFSLRISRRPSQDDTNNEEDQDGGDSTEQTSPKFRFGPLVWRASRERNNKKGATNKAARNAKCNSGDSGVQMESPSHTMDETEASNSVRRTQSDLGGEAAIVAALRSSPTCWNQASAISQIPEAAKNRSRKLTRSLAKAHLRRSASQPVVVLPGGIRPDGPSDEDAGLCLSEDDNLSDCGGNIPQAENEAVRYNAATEGVLAIALWDHNAVEAEELSLQSGDVVHILDLSDPNWWWAARGQQYGWLPASYVQLCEQPFHRKQGLAQGQKFARTLTPAGMAALQHSVRANVINELVTAERDYVKLLSDLVDGYLKPMKSRPDLFSPQRIQSIFGNLEELYRFQKGFLVDLEHSLNWNALEDSVVGGCFLQHIQEFAIYATYCNNQDRAAAEMQLLCDDIRYLRFFEACRLLRRMIRLPLEAFLLSPVQKICKYPLQLAELYKHTPDEHPDRRLVSLALDSMRSVAYLVNESKRRAEMQQFLVHWQSGVDHWMGSDITTFNSRLVHQGELFKISSNGWTREVTLFLFDKELVICKKELIKRSSLVYKDRLNVEDIEVLEPLTMVDVRPHSFQLRSFSRAKAYLLACRSAQDKNQWIAAIQHLQQHSSEWPIFPAPTNMNFGRQKMSKRSKVKQNPALILTLEEAHRTLEGRDLPTKRKS